MLKYLIEREIPEVGMQPTEELRAAAQTSNDVLSTLAPRVQWQQSFITTTRGTASTSPTTNEPSTSTPS